MTCVVKIENAESRDKIYSKWVEIVSEGALSFRFDWNIATKQYALITSEYSLFA